MPSITIEGLFPSPLGAIPEGGLRQYRRCEDGWIIKRSAVPATGGRHDGKYVVLAYRPTGRARPPKEWELAYDRGFKLRRAAKLRADELWRAHSPAWDAKHPASS
jgi:hypothetical protein